MKKTLLLLCALLTLGVSGAWATITTSFLQGLQVTTSDGIVDGGKYVIRVSGASYITENGTQYEAPNTQNTLTANAVFTFHQNGDAWTVENETTGNYWGTLTGAETTGTFAPVEAVSAGSWTFTFNDNNIDFTSGGYHINRSSGVMHGWGSAIALQIYNAEEIKLVGAISDFSNNKAYYVTTYDRGAWFVPLDGTAITSTSKAGFAASMSDTKQQFAFLTYGTTDVYHLYSVSEKKFVSKSGNYTTLTSEIGENVTLLSTTNASYPFVVALNDGANQMGISNGYDPAVITFWNDVNDGGNQVQIREVADFDPTEAMAILEAAYSTTVNVTYEVYDGETLVESQKVVQDKNSAVAIPAALQKNSWYYDYAASGTIGESDCTITVNRSYKTGVVTSLSSLSNDKAYKLVTERGTFTTVDGALDNTAKSGSSYTVYNFALVNYDDAYYLWSEQDGKFVSGDGTKLTETPTAITINALDEPLFKIQCGSNYMNCNTDQGGFFSTWSTTDGGNKIAIIEAADFDPTPVIAAITNVASSVVANIKPYFDAAGTGLFQLKSSVAEANNAKYTAALTMCSTTTYNELLAVVNDAENFNLPETGKFYLVKNNYNGKYMRVTASGTRGTVFADLTAEEAAKDASAHFCFVENASHLYMSTQGEYLNWVYGVYAGYEGFTSTSFDKFVHFAVPAPGVGAFSIAFGNGVGDYAGYLGSGFYALKNSSTTVVAGSASNQLSELAQWTFEEVSTIDFSLTASEGNTYSTLYLPFGVTLPDGVDAYVISSVGERAQTVKIGKNIPAGTAVILRGENASTTAVTATIDNAVSASIGTNVLQGTYFSKALTDDDVVLGISLTTGIGFYKKSGDSPTIGANKAYLNLSGSPVKSFALSFDDDLTGISSTINVNANTQKMFDLSGRAVSGNAQKGIYIIGGKKVLVK